MNPNDIGKRKAPAQMDAEDAYLKNVDQVHFSELQDKHESGDLKRVWDGTGYLVDALRKAASDNPSLRKHLVPILKKYAQKTR
jgi:hypothetical protein